MTSSSKDAPKEIAILIAEGFNLAATMAFIDPFRAANYLAGEQAYRWCMLHTDAAPPRASNGLAIDAEYVGAKERAPAHGVISTSWTPERAEGDFVPLARRWARHGAHLVGIDTGGFVLASAGLLDGRRATVHYEHIDAFAETFPEVDVCEDLYVLDTAVSTACGGGGAVDLALQIIARDHGPKLANAAARYVFHERMRPEGAQQLPPEAEPVGATVPEDVRRAIQVMEAHLENVLRIPEVAAQVPLSQRRLERLFLRHLGKSPARYYADIRLDRARGLVVQTDMPIGEVALASGFASTEHFSRAYSRRFDASPRADRNRGRVPFEFRAWPMHERGGRM